MTVVELAALPGTGKSTVQRRVVELASEQGWDARPLLGSEVARGDAPPASWLHRRRADRVLDRSVPTQALRSNADPDRTSLIAARHAHFWQRRHEVAEAVRQQRPVVFEEGMLHELWRLAHWLGYPSSRELDRLARREAVGTVLIHLQADLGAVVERCGARLHPGPINRELLAWNGDRERWGRAADTYQRLVDQLARRRDVQVITLSTQTRADTERTARRIAALMDPSPRMTAGTGPTSEVEPHAETSAR